MIRDFKRYTAKNAGVIWQDGFFDHRLRDHESLEEKALYIRMNPVRAGLVPRPDAWPYIWPGYSVPETAR
jgi:putative transposase